MDDGTFPALLKTLSDTSEEVIKHDLQLLAQISSSSEESYFKAFMVNLLDLFSTDKRLLETRGSLIIRQLCLSLNTERIYRTLAEILEKEEDLEFASDMVQKLNLILITCPELAESRRRLKMLETRVCTFLICDGGVDLIGSSSPIARRTGVVCYALSVMVSQRCCSVLAMFACSSI
jgi:vacuole morphology and inheritance protein 14